MFPLPERKARPISETVRLEVSVPQTSYWKEAVAQQSSSWMHFFNTEFPLEVFCNLTISFKKNYVKNNKVYLTSVVESGQQLSCPN